MKLNLQEKLKHKVSRAYLETQINKIVQHLILNKSSIPVYLILFFIVILAIIVHINGLYVYSTESDNYWIYQYTLTIHNNKNPYLRILNSDMIRNDKYPTFPPLYFYLGLIPLYLGYSSYPSWIIFMKTYFLFPADFGIALLIFLILKRHSNAKPWFSVFAIFIWLFNRWTLYIYTYALIDTFTIFFILLSLYYFDSQPEFSSLLLGVSIAIKLFPIFLLPLYLISHRSKSVYRILAYLFLAIMPILLVSLPYLIWSPEAYYRSLLFSATRQGDKYYRLLGPELMPSFGYYGFDTRYPLIICYLGFYFVHWMKKFNTYMFTTAGLLIWNLMNTNVYPQYWIWFIPFALILFGLTIFTYTSSDSNSEISSNGFRKDQQ